MDKRDVEVKESTDLGVASEQYIIGDKNPI